MKERGRNIVNIVFWINSIGSLVQLTALVCIAIFMEGLPAWVGLYAGTAIEILMVGSVVGMALSAILVFLVDDVGRKAVCCMFFYLYIATVFRELAVFLQGG